MWRCSEQAALQLRMEGLRRGKGKRKKGLPISDPHVDRGKGVKPQYITRRKIKKEGETKKEKRRKRKRKRTKG